MSTILLIILIVFLFSEFGYRSWGYPGGLGLGGLLLLILIILILFGRI